MKQVAVFVDVSNLYYCVGKSFTSRKLDYRRYMDNAKHYGEIYRAIAYGSFTGDVASKFINCLRSGGYTTKFRKYDEDKRLVNWNTQIAVDVVNIVSKVDIVIFGSADPDLIPIVDWLESRGIQVINIASGIGRQWKKNNKKIVEITEDLLEDIQEGKDG